MYAQVDLSVPRSHPPLLIPRRHPGGARGRAAGGRGGCRRQGSLHAHSAGPRLSATGWKCCPGLEEGQQIGGQPQRRGARGRPSEASDAAIAGAASKPSKSDELSTSEVTHRHHCTSRPLVCCAGPLFCARTGARGSGPPVSFQNSPRVHELMRAGNLYLSLSGRAGAWRSRTTWTSSCSATPCRAPMRNCCAPRAAALMRGLELHAGGGSHRRGRPAQPGGDQRRGGPGAPPRAASVATNALELGVLGDRRRPTSRCREPFPSRTVTAVPSYDRAITGQLNWTHQTTPQASPTSAGATALVSDTTLANAGIQQGFATGAQVGLSFNNNRQSVNSLVTQYNPLHRLQPGADRHAAAAARLRRQPQPPLHPHRGQRAAGSPACCSGSSSSPRFTA